MSEYRQLTMDEVAILKGNGCVAEDWDCVMVAEGFVPESVVNVRFSGKVELGVFSGYVALPGGVSVPCGIRNAFLCNVSVGNRVLIRNVHGYISNYDIGEGVCISDVGSIYMDGVSSFGNGTEVNVLNETGGRTVTIYDGMSAQVAYFQAIYRHRYGLSGIIESMSGHEAEASASSRGAIAAFSRIENVGTLKNVKVGEHALLRGCLRLVEGTVSSSADSPVFIGEGVVCDEFIIQSGASLDAGTVLSRTFVGQNVCLAKGFSCSDCLFFANSHCENGEAVSVFAGPYTVSHHKSTLLIGSLYSFMNAGSSTNFSNHRYKLGPVHQGWFGRGVKFGSGSYMLLPVRVAPFTTVLGHHVSGIDSSDMPFSYIVESSGESYLIPGIVLGSSGLFRDGEKWPRRDRRKPDCRHDHVIYDVFSPYTAGKMLSGIDILVSMLSGESISGAVAAYGGCKVSPSSVTKGIGRYDAAVKFYVGKKVAERLEGRVLGSDQALRDALVPESSVGSGVWIDVAGLLAPKVEIENLLDELEQGSICGKEDLERRLSGMEANYPLYEWRWVYDHLNQVFGIDPTSVTRRKLAAMLEQWASSALLMLSGIENDAMKEYSESVMTGFGADGGKQEADIDFRNVRGCAENDGIILDIRKMKESIRSITEGIVLSL